MAILRKNDENVSESLTGKVGILSMFSFSRAEIESRESIPFLPSKVKNTVSDDNISDIFEKIMRGSMPQLVCDSKLLADIAKDVEIKMSADPGKNVLKNFSVLSSLNEEVGEGAVLCMTSAVIPLDENNKMVPIKII